MPPDRRARLLSGGNNSLCPRDQMGNLVEIPFKRCHSDFALQRDAGGDGSRILSPKPFAFLTAREHLSE
jgi:hypothetical protein